MELTEANLEKAWKEAKKVDTGSGIKQFLVPVSFKKKLDGIWKKLPWYIKLYINIGRLIRGYGLYRAN
jgi:hypothetical protein